MNRNILILKKRGRPKKVMDKKFKSKIVSFEKDKKLSRIAIDPKMLEIMKGGLEIDKLISYEGGLPRATNSMWGGPPGVGKTTILLDFLSSLVKKESKVLFISLEMGKVQMFKYLQRFPQFGVIETLFGSDYLDNNIKDVIEQKFDLGYDAILIDSIVELLSIVREDCDFDKRQAEKWFVDLCTKHNKGENQESSYTSFLGIQQLNISNGEFVGGGKLKYLFDSNFKFEKDKKTGSTSIIAEKNRNGLAGVPLYYDLGEKIIYTKFEAVIENLDE